MAFIKLELFSLFCFGLIALTFIILKKKQVSIKGENIAFLIGALLTTLTHYLPIIIGLVKGEHYTLMTLENNYYLPVWPCNMLMWLNMIMIPFMFKRGKVIEIVSPFIFFFGTLGATLGLVANINYFHTPDWTDLSIVKGLVSHVFLIFTCVSVKVFNLFKIRTVNTIISCFVGITAFVLCELFSNYILTLQGKDTVDALMLYGSSYGKWINFFTVAPIVFILLLTITTIYEIKVLPIEDRWYSKLFRKEQKQ